MKPLKSKPTRQKNKPKGRARICAKTTEASSESVPNLSKSAPNLSKPVSKTTLTAKQLIFIVEYLIDLNATQAVIRAGYSVRTANRIATVLLSKPVIRAAIDTAIEERKKRVLVTTDDVIREMVLIGMADMKDFVEIDEGGTIRALPLDTLAEG
jgi:hypothetical protein